MKGQCYDYVDAIKQKADDELRCILRESFKLHSSMGKAVEPLN